MSKYEYPIDPQMSKFGKFIGNVFVGAIATLERRAIEHVKSPVTESIDDMLSGVDFETVWRIRPDYRGRGPLSIDSFPGGSHEVYLEWLSDLEKIAPIEFDFPDADWDGWGHAKPLRTIDALRYLMEDA